MCHPSRRSVARGVYLETLSNRLESYLTQYLLSIYMCVCTVCVGFVIRSIRITRILICIDSKYWACVGSASGGFPAQLVLETVIVETLPGWLVLFNLFVADTLLMVSNILWYIFSMGNVKTIFFWTIKYIYLKLYLNIFI